MTSDDLTTRLNDALRLIEEATEAASKKVTAGPDNPAIKRHGIGFSIQMSEVLRKNSWDPFTHDWVAQYKHVADLLRARRFSALREVLANGGYRDRSHGWRGFAWEVIEHVRSITGDLQVAVAQTDAGRLRQDVRPMESGVEIERAEPRQLIGRQLEQSHRTARRRP